MQQRVWQQRNARKYLRHNEYSRGPSQKVPLLTGQAPNTVPPFHEPSSKCISGISRACARRGNTASVWRFECASVDILVRDEVPCHLDNLSIGTTGSLFV